MKSYRERMTRALLQRGWDIRESGDDLIVVVSRSLDVLIRVDVSADDPVPCGTASARAPSVAGYDANDARAMAEAWGWAATLLEDVASERLAQVEFSTAADLEFIRRLRGRPLKLESTKREWDDVERIAQRVLDVPNTKALNHGFQSTWLFLRALEGKLEYRLAEEVAS